MKAEDQITKKMRHAATNADQASMMLFRGARRIKLLTEALQTANARLMKLGVPMVMVGAEEVVA